MYIRSFTKVVDDAMDIVQTRKGEMMLSNFLMTIILLGGIMAVTTAGMIAIGVMGVIGIISNTSIVGVVGLILLTLLSLTMVAVAEGSIIILTDCYYHGQSVGATYATGRSLKRMPALMGYICLEILGCIPLIILGGLGLFIVVGGLQGISSMIDQVTNPSGLAFIAVTGFLISTVVLTLVLIVYNTFFVFGVAAIVIDELGPIEAFKKNLRLIKGEFLTIVKKLVLIRLGIMGINICFTMLFGLLGIVLGVVSFFNSSFNSAIMQIVANVIEWPARVVFSLLYFAFSPAIIAVFYYNQKCRKEGTDLHKQLHGLKRKAQNQRDNINEAINGSINQAVEPTQESYDMPNPN